MAGSISDINVRIGAIIKPLEQSLGKAERKLRRSGAKMARLGSELTQTISISLLGIGAAAIKTAGDFEALENGLISIMGSAEAAKEEMALLRKESLKPGLNLTQAVKGSVRLQSVGINAELARNALTNFGNAIALAGGSSTDLDGVTLALTQIISKGKISAEEINQLAERVPQVRKAIQTAFGTGDSEQLQKLGISAEQFVQKVTMEMGKLPQATSGIKNAIENVGQGLQMFLVDIGTEINKAFNITELANKFSEKLQNISLAFQNLDDSTKKTILKVAAFAAAIGPVFFALGKVKLALAAVGGMLKTIFSLSSLRALLNPWTLGLMALVGIGVMIVKNWDVVKKAIVNVVNAVIELYNSNTKLKLQIAAITGAFKTLWEVARSIIRNIGTAITSLFRAIAEGLAGNLGAAKAELKKGLMEIAVDIGETGNELGDIWADRFEKAAKNRLSQVDESMFSSLESAVGNAMSGLGGGGVVTTSGGGSKKKTKGLEAIDINRSIPGREVLDEAITALEDYTIKALMATQQSTLFAEAIAAYEGPTNIAIENFAKMSEKVQAILEGVETVAESMGAAMMQAAKNGESSLKGMANAALGAAKQTIGALIAEGVTAAVSKALSSAPYPLNLILGPLAGAAAFAMFNAVTSKIPGFAKGTINAPRGFAMVGEDGPEMVHFGGGERVIPNNKLGGMGGGNVMVTVRGIIRGQDLLLVQEKAQQIKDRLA